MSKNKKNCSDYKEKYNLHPDIANRYGAWVSNPSVQPDEKTEMNAPIPCSDNVEFAKDYQEENKL